MHDIKHEGNKFSLAFSPCPNDTFMMDALVHHKIAHCNEFDVSLMDIQALNESALKGLYDVTKISAAALPQVSDEYQLLDAGSAMGFGCGPIVVSSNKYSLDDLVNSVIGIPGRHTTAHYLFNHFVPEVRNKKFLLFSDIEQKILDKETEAGVLIHEGRFTYADHGLSLIADLGALWEKKYHLPIPLGVIVCRKSLGTRLATEMQTLISKSIEYAFEQPWSSREYIKQHAQELDDHVIDQHIQLYVNRFSISMGEEGHRAIQFLLSNPI